MSINILRILPKSFRANTYSKKPFRMIGLVDAEIEYYYGTERVTLAFYRSSGTYSGKTSGLWYPIVGIKTVDGYFTEFTDYINFVMAHSTKMGMANSGWLAKSLFFSERGREGIGIRGFSNGSHHDELLKIGSDLRYLYETNQYYSTSGLDAESMNRIVAAERIYPNNEHSQRENFERLIEDIYTEDVADE